MYGEYVITIIIDIDIYVAIIVRVPMHLTMRCA